MPRALVIVSRRPVDLADHLMAAADVDPNLGLRTIWNGGATQICSADGAAHLTVLRTKGFDVLDDVERLLGTHFPADHAFWTELYAPLGTAGDRGLAVAQALAAAVGGDLVQSPDA